MKFSTKLIFSYFGFTLLATILIGVFLYSFEIEDQEKLHWMGIGLILFASALLSLIVVANRLIKPIILLKEAVIKLGQGDFNITVPVLSQDEIGELSQAFNRMAQLLRENVIELNRVQQITETAHDNLYETNERFQAIFESVTDCILVWDKDYIYLYANQAALDYIHKTSEQMIGKTITQVFVEFPEFVQLWMKRINQVFISGQPLKVEDSTFGGEQIAYSESVLSPIKDRQGRVSQSVLFIEM
jgi:PAS domain S-box-containing protein